MEGAGTGEMGAFTISLGGVIENSFSRCRCLFRSRSSCAFRSNSGSTWKKMSELVNGRMSLWLSNVASTKKVLLGLDFQIFSPWRAYLFTIRITLICVHIYLFGRVEHGIQ